MFGLCSPFAQREGCKVCFCFVFGQVDGAINHFCSGRQNLIYRGFHIIIAIDLKDSLTVRSYMLKRPRIAGLHSGCSTN